jgi:hypothetical protein
MLHPSLFAFYKSISVTGGIFFSYTLAVFEIGFPQLWMLNSLNLDNSFVIIQLYLIAYILTKLLSRLREFSIQSCGKPISNTARV